MNKKIFSFARLSTLAPFFVCILFYWDFFYIYRFRIADEFCSCLYSRKFSKKIFTKILIGDFRFLCKKRISKDKFGIKMLGNVYTEEINKSWLCRSRAFYLYYFIVISWCKQVLFMPLFKKLFKKYLPLRLYIWKRLIGADKTSIVQPKMTPLFICYTTSLFVSLRIWRIKMIKRDWKLPNPSYFTYTSIVQPVLQVYNLFLQANSLFYSFCFKTGKFEAGKIAAKWYKMARSPPTGPPML